MATLAKLIACGEIRGVTSNPSIFNKAISASADYDAALQPMAWAGWKPERIFFQLAIEDIQRTADLFLPLYQKTNGGDGYVSLEVNPALAHDTRGYGDTGKKAVAGGRPAEPDDQDPRHQGRHPGSAANASPPA